MVWGNALGIPLMGLVQAVAGLFIYWLVGVPDIWMWFAVTFVAGMLPLLGVALAYVPLSLILLGQGEEGKALLILLYGFIVMGSVDNIARMWLMKKITHAHPLITLFGVVDELPIVWVYWLCISANFDLPVHFAAAYLPQGVSPSAIINLVFSEFRFSAL